MQIVLLIVLLIIVLPYVAGPILLWVNGSRMYPLNLVSADPAKPLPTKAAAHFWKTTHYFSSNGFEMFGERQLESAPNGLAMYKQMWRHPRTAEFALVGAITKQNDPEFCNAFAAFLHERASGAFIITTNFNVGARAFLDQPGTSKIVVSHQDPADLRALHQGHVAVYNSEAVRPVRAKDAEALSRQMDATTRHVALSRKRFRAEGESLRITARGALFSIWANLPPFKGKFDKADNRLLAAAFRAGAEAGLAMPNQRAAA
jgi:hypothetical protein